MARGKGEVEPRQGLKSHFVERMVNLPIVHVAWDYAANTYSTIKESNRLVNFTLTNAEKSVTFMAGQAKPVVMKFEKQIQAVDDLACKGLGTLEEKVPFITKRPDEIIDDTKGLYSSTIYSRVEDIVKYGNSKVKNVTDIGFQTISAVLGSPVVNSVLGTVDGALVITENYINHYLPAEESEQNENHVNHHPKEEASDKISPVARIARITSLIRKRGYHVAVIHMRRIQDRSMGLLDLPDQLLSFTIVRIEEAKQLIESIWEELNSTESKEQDQSVVRKQLISVLRPLTKQLIILYARGYELLPKVSAPKGKEDGSATTNNSVSHSPKVVNTLADGVLRVLGLIRTIPALLPIYIYVLISWLNPEKDGTSDKSVDTREENGPIESEKIEQNHVEFHTPHESFD